MSKPHHETRIDESINRFYPEISGNTEIIPDIPENTALLIFNQLLAFICDASNIMLICYAKELINKIPAEWLKNNVRKAVELRTEESWIFDMSDLYVYGNLKELLTEWNCTDKISE